MTCVYREWWQYLCIRRRKWHVIDQYSFSFISPSNSPRLRNMPCSSVSPPLFRSDLFSKTVFLFFFVFILHYLWSCTSSNLSPRLFCNNISCTSQTPPFRSSFLFRNRNDVQSYIFQADVIFNVKTNRLVFKYYYILCILSSEIIIIIYCKEIIVISTSL